MRLWDWLFGKKGGLGVDALAEWLGVTEEELRAVKPAYTEKMIPKRGGGQRRLLIPDTELKAVQRRIERRLLRHLKAHPAATGFERRHSIVTNAAYHAGKRVVISVDIREFFPSTGAVRVRKYFQLIGWNRDAANLLTGLCTWEDGLPQGSPASPRLSNLVNVPLDGYLWSAAAKRGVAYTRYADDLTFSSDEARDSLAREMVAVASRALAWHGYTMHRGKKLRIMRRHDRQNVTGLVVNDGPRLPRETRRWLRAVRHRRASTGAATLTDEQLAGWESLARMVETQSGRG